MQGGRLAFLPRLKTHEHHRRVGEVQRVEDVVTGQSHRRAHSLGAAHDALYLFEYFIGQLQGRALRQCDRDEKIALVLIRNEAAGHDPANHPDTDHHRDQQQHRAGGLAGQATHDGPVAAGHPIKSAIKELEELRDRAASRRRFLEQHSAQGGAERQRVDDREDDRHRNGEGELLVELAGHAAHARHRNEHGAQDESDGHHRARDFFHRLAGGFSRGHAMLEVVLHRLDYHDGVVHDDADGQDQAEHREHVDAEAEHREHDERPQQRDRHSDTWG